MSEIQKLRDELELARLERDEARDRLQDVVDAGFSACLNAAMKERERCANVCEMVRDDIVNRCLMHTGVATAERCASDIRNQAKGA